VRDRILSCGFKGCLGAVVIILLVGVALVVYGWVGAARETNRFKGMASELQAACALCFADANAPSKIVRHGRAIVVEAESGKALANTQSLLDEAVRARKPEELGTVVCVTPAERSVAGTYTDGGKGYRVSRDACAIRWPDKTLLFQRHLVGSNPPGAKSGRGDQQGSDPAYGELATELEQAPEQ
jgi:hypothetical protein